MRLEIVESSQLSDEAAQALTAMDAAVYPPKPDAQQATEQERWAPPQWHILIRDSDQQLVSHVGVLTRICLCDGDEILIGGIGGVMTHPSERRKGYAGAGLRRATKFLQQEMRVDLSLLFCGPRMLSYYRRFGFRNFAGEDISGYAPDAVYNSGIARGYQEPSLYFKMTVLDNILLPVKGQRGEKPWYAPRWSTWQRDEAAHARRAIEVLEQVQLMQHYATLAADLSGGQMKLLEIARALMGQPKLLLLDEPTAGVAPKLAYEIFQQIARLRDDYGITFLIVEHRLEILFDFVDYVYVMHLGNLLAQGAPADIAEDTALREVYFGD